jgi:hypothetical protein
MREKHCVVVMALLIELRRAEHPTRHFITSTPSPAPGCPQWHFPSPTRCISLFDIRCTCTMVVRVHEILIRSPNLVTYLSGTQNRLARWRMQRPVSPAEYRCSAASGSRCSLRSTVEASSLTYNACSPTPQRRKRLSGDEEGSPPAVSARLATSRSRVCEDFSANSATVM